MVDILGYIVENFTWLASVLVLSYTLLLTLSPPAQADDTLYSYISAEVDYCTSQTSQSTLECMQKKLETLNSRYRELYVDSDIGSQVDYVIYEKNDDEIVSTNTELSQRKAIQRMNSCLIFTSCISFYFNDNEQDDIEQFQIVILP